MEKHGSDPAGALSGALRRSRGDRDELLSRAGPLLSAAEVARLLGVEGAETGRLRDARGLLALRIDADWAYPALQVRDGAALPGLDRLLRAHCGKDPWAILDLLLAPDPALNGRTPLEALRDGDAEGLSRHIAQLSGDGFA